MKYVFPADCPNDVRDRLVSLGFPLICGPFGNWEYWRGLVDAVLAGKLLITRAYPQGPDSGTLTHEVR
jgi:hypothetical protein